MLKRLFIGLFLGALIGAVVAAVLIQVLHIVTFGPVLAYLSAIVTGVVTGLVAGKPIWSADGKIEAGLKAFFGGLLALGGMFALRQWVHADINLSSMNAGHAELGWLPAASLPLIAGVLAAFFELDNTGGDPEADAKKKDGAKDTKASGKKLRVAEEEEAAEDEEEEATPAKKRR
ncbi:MAG: hypothetical protein KIT84_42400 [Labilithrix sp.]|nr:hypothetical protein [Labilithrix sp.]MCW5817728.1 hypothetical protein [Labilithrix sp.]